MSVINGHAIIAEIIKECSLHESSGSVKSFTYIQQVTRDILERGGATLGYSENIRRKIKKRMSRLFEENRKEYARWATPEKIVFLLMVRAIRDLRLPYQSSKMITVLIDFCKQYMLR